MQTNNVTYDAGEDNVTKTTSNIHIVSCVLKPYIQFVRFFFIDMVNP